MPTTRPIVKKAVAGAIIGPALQLGQTLGEMMPDNIVGDGLKGVLNPMDAIGRGIDNLSEGKILRGLLSFTPAGGFIDSHFRRKEDAEAEAKAKEAAYKTSFNSRVAADKDEALMMSKGMNRISLYAKGGRLNAMDNVAAVANSSANASSVPNRGSMQQQYGAPHSIGLNNGAQILTDSNGSTIGTHESGANVPIVSDGQTQAIAEPGEVLVNNPDGSATILAKRNGLAQQYIQLENTASQIRMALNTETDIAKQNALKRELAAIEIQKESVKRMQDELAAQIEASGQQPMADPNAIPMAPDGIRLKSGKIVPDNEDIAMQQANLRYYEYFPQENHNEINAASTLGYDERMPPVDHDYYNRHMSRPNRTDMGINTRLLPRRDNTVRNPWEEMPRAPIVSSSTASNTTNNSRSNKSTKTSTARTPLSPINTITPQSGDNAVARVSNYSKPINYTPPPVAATPSMEMRNSAGSIAGVPKAPIDAGKVLDVAGNIAQMALPVVANIKARNKMNDMMKLVNEYQPDLLKTFRTNYKTEIADQVAAANNADANNRRIAEKVANPLTAATIANVSGAQRIENLNPVHANRINVDNRIKLQQDAIAQQNAAMNTQLINAAKDTKLNAALGKIRAEIDLSNQTVANIYTQIQEKNLKESDLLRVSMAMKHLNQYGVITRNYADILKAAGIDIQGITVKD